MEYTIFIEKNEQSGMLVGQCQQLPAAMSQGKDLKELMANMKEAIELLLESNKEDMLNNRKGQKFIRRRLKVTA